jgi:hypothetical protein
MWIGWIAVAAAFIVGAIYFAMRDSEKGEKYVASVPGAVVEPRCAARHCAVRIPRVALNDPKTPKTTTLG